MRSIMGFRDIRDIHKTSIHSPSSTRAPGVTAGAVSVAGSAAGHGGDAGNAAGHLLRLG